MLDAPDPPAPASAGAPPAPAHPLPLLPVLGATTRTQWAAVLSVGVLAFSINIPILVEMSRQNGERLTGAGLVALTAPDLAFWFLALVPVFAVLDRTPFVPGRRARHGAARVAVAAVTVAAYALLVVAARDLLSAAHVSDPRRSVPPIAAALPAPVSWTVLVDGAGGFALLTVGHVILQRVHRGQRTIRWAADLRLSAANAQLQALALELQPHFLFNTLNGIAELLHEAPRDAERMLLALSAMLRETVETRRAPLIPLGAELEQLGRYLALQQMRFGPRLRVEWRVDPAALAAEVPTMLLQPLVENALSHGLERRPGPGLLRITAERRGPMLHLDVCDDGVGLPAGGVRREGLGLGNTRERLAMLFGERASLVLGPGPGCGAQAVVTLPWRSAPETPATPGTSRPAVAA